MDDKYNDNKLKIEDIPILKDFKDIFLEEVPRLPSERDKLYNQYDARISTSIEISLPNEHKRDYRTQITITIIN